MTSSPILAQLKHQLADLRTLEAATTDETELAVLRQRIAAVEARLDEVEQRLDTPPSWRFDIRRDENGLIATVHASPQ